MTTLAPIYALWDGEMMQPLKRFKAECDAALVIGKVYRVEVKDDATAKSRAHYFAKLREMWLSLPEPYANQFPDPEILRAHALVVTGFCNSRQFVEDTPFRARRLQKFLRARPIDSGENYSVVQRMDCVITELTPKSQKEHMMGKEEFQKSKSAVLEYVESLLGIAAKPVEQVP